MGARANLLLDDAFIAAPLDRPYNADDVLTRKPARDENTLMLLDFEKDDPALKLEGSAQLTKPDGGRFGRGLRLEGGELWRREGWDEKKAKIGLATSPFKLPAMPDEGTIECWLSLDEMSNLNREGFNKYLQLCGADGVLFHLGASTDQTLSCRWGSDTYQEGGNYLPANAEFTARRMHKGDWHHVAVTWDRSAWRFYMDGTLAGMTTKPPLGWAGGACGGSCGLEIRT